MAAHEVSQESHDPFDLRGSAAPIAAPRRQAVGTAAQQANRRHEPKLVLPTRAARSPRPLM
jgi:hypothetical protein